MPRSNPKCSKCHIEFPEHLKAKKRDCWAGKSCENKRDHYRHPERNERRRKQSKLIDVDMEGYRSILYVWRVNKSSPIQQVYAELKKGSEVVCHTKKKDCAGVGRSEFEEYCRKVLDLFGAECGIEFKKFNAIVEKGDLDDGKTAKFFSN